MPASSRDHQASSEITACAETVRSACRSHRQSCDCSHSSCSSSLGIPVFMISELSPMKHQPAASNCQRSSPITAMNCGTLLFGCQLQWRGAERRRVVADVVIAWQIAGTAPAAPSCSSLANSRSLRLVGPSKDTSPLLTTRSGRAASMCCADALKILGQAWRSGRREKDAYRKFASDEIRSCITPFAAIIAGPEVGTMTTSNAASPHRRTPRRRGTQYAAASRFRH